MRLKTTTKILLALAALAPVSAFASTTNPTVATWQMTKYDTVTANGLVETSQTSATGNTVKSRTDGLGRTIEQVDALGNISTAEYDANGNLTKSRDANGVGQDCTYDAQNRRTACTDTFGSTRTTKYSVGGLTLNQQDAKSLWNTTDTVYDARGRVVQTGTRLVGDLTSYSYDANGNKLTVTDGEGKVTTYAYDNRNLKTAWTFPGQTSTTRGAAGYDKVEYAYDAAARLEKFTRQDGSSDETAYNFNGTVASKTYKLANGSTESQDTYTYDASNRPLTASKGRYNNTVAFQYDAIGRKQEESLTTGGNTYPMQYAYDADNRVTQVTYPNGKVATKTYTARNQLASVSFDGQAILTAAAYDAGGRETSRTLGNGVIQDRTYRTDGLLSAITTQGDAASSLTYGYDQNKNLTAETFGGATANYSATMAQDAKDRLTSQARTNGDAQNWNLTKEGNWASVTTNATTETRTHNDNHQITALSSTANAPTYDAQGDLTADEQARVYSWDQEKNLTGIVGGATNVGFAYDALGRRVSKTSNGDTTVFVSAGNQEIAEYYNGSLTKEHVYGTYVDENIATKDATNGWQYRVMDRRYSTTALLDSVGAVIERYVYDVYGKTTVLSPGGAVRTSAPLTEVLWTGRRLDSETGVYYFRSRYFSTTLGRFISRDIDYLDGWNLYEGYFAERIGMDPSGMKFVYDIKEVSLSEIQAEVPGSYAFTAAGVLGYGLSGEDVIKEKQDASGKWCAHVVKTKEITLTARVRLPHKKEMVGIYMTADAYRNQNGYNDMVHHEYRRLTSMKNGYDAYFKNASDSGWLARKCGELCDCKKGVAKAKLEDYLSRLRSDSFDKYRKYDKENQKKIDVENEHWLPRVKSPGGLLPKDIGGTGTGYVEAGLDPKYIYDPESPEEYKGVDCP